MSAATTKPSPERLETVRRLNLVRRPEQVPKRISDPAEQYPTGRRAQVERLVKGVLRHRNLLDALLMATESFDARKTPGIIMWILRLAAYEKPDIDPGLEADLRRFVDERQAQGAGENGRVPA